MSLTEQEIFSQYEALEKTYNYMLSRKQEIKDYFERTGLKNVAFIGCGSSYSVSKSLALAARLRLDMTANAYCAGDLLVNIDSYHRILKDALLVSVSRSGATSEVLMLADEAKRKHDAPCVSICAKSGAPLSLTAGLNLEIPWAFDESVCQTRCVTNLYMAGMLMVGILADDEDLLRAFKAVIERGDAYMRDTRAVLEKIAGEGWGRVVVLADGELGGIAEEGALAFNEISYIHSHYYHLLDVRHGPIVLIDDKTLVIAALTPGDTEHQDNLLRDIKKRGAVLAVFSDRSEVPPHADYHIAVPPQKAVAAQGIPFIFIPQALSLFTALRMGINPDLPAGLDPWIKL